MMGDMMMKKGAIKPVRLVSQVIVVGVVVGGDGSGDEGL
jgi:hypothetical protein